MTDSNDTLDLSPQTLPHYVEVRTISAWILTHPHWQKAFIDFKPADVVAAVLAAIKECRIGVAKGPDGEIVGVLIYKADAEMKVVHIEQLLGIGPAIVDAALEGWKHFYPEYAVTMIRHGKFRRYEFNQFFE